MGTNRDGTRVTTPGRQARERSNLEKVESPGLSADIEDELEAKVHVFRNRTGPMTMDEANEVDDPFSGVYESDYRAVKAEDVEKFLVGLAETHSVDRWLELRKAERERIVALREAAERDLVKVQEDEASEEVLKIATSAVVDLQKREDRLIGSTIAKDGVTLAKRVPGDVVISHALEVEDDRAGVVETVSRNLIIEPEFHPGLLEQLVLNNSSLTQLVNAMEVNVAGTGWELVAMDTLKMEAEIEGAMPGTSDPDERATAREEMLRAREAAELEFQEEVDGQRESLEGFFREPWPGMSFTTIRRQLRDSKEKTGNSYLEVLRNAAGEIVFARTIDPKLMRLVRLDDPVVVEKTLERGGAEVTQAVSIRERRFVQHVGGGALVPKFHQPGFGSPSLDPNARSTEMDTRRLFSSQGTRVVYFKEFGASRDLDMWTGIWAQDGEEIPMERRATEIIHETVIKSPRTPYGLPRWINNLPSVMGNRKAEEFNLAFFRAGGVPPLLITVAGGQMAERSRKALDEMMNNQNPASKHQAVLLEISSSGRMDKANKVTVDVVRFGSERMQDSMFQKYDQQTRFKIRESFRLPPLFIGDPEAHNFATAKASYLVAEAQVFQPERDEEDEIYTMKLLRNMPNGLRFRFRSLPLVIDDAADQVKCIEIAADNSLVGGEQLVEALNKVCNLELKFDREHSDLAREERMTMRTTMAEAFARTNTQGEAAREEEPGGGSDESGEIQGGAPTGTSKIAKAGDVLTKLDGLVVLGSDLAEALGKGFENATARKDLKANMAFYEGLSLVEKQVVDRVMAFRGLGEDRDDLMELFGCSAAIIASNAERQVEIEAEPSPEA